MLPKFPLAVFFPCPDGGSLDKPVSVRLEYFLLLSLLNSLKVLDLLK